MIIEICAVRKALIREGVFVSIGGLERGRENRVIAYLLLTL